MPERRALHAKDILGVLTAHRVDFVVIGGIALILHGSARNTFDVDVCFAGDDENLAAFGSALTELGASLRGVAESAPFTPDARTLRQIEVLTLETPKGELDVLTRPAGAPPIGCSARKPSASISEDSQSASPRSTISSR